MDVTKCRNIEQYRNRIKTKNYVRCVWKLKSSKSMDSVKPNRYRLIEEIPGEYSMREASENNAPGRNPCSVVNDINRIDEL